MQTVRQIAQQIVDREGGYVDAPEDPGGATNFGVTGMWTNTMCRC